MKAVRKFAGKGTENMKTRRREWVPIDPGRSHTKAEVRLVMDVYSCDELRARSILNVRPPPPVREEIRGMVDAVLVEQAIVEGRILKIPGWLIRGKMI